MEEFIITRIYADNNGDTHFEDIDVPLTSAGPIGYLSGKFPVKDLIFRQVLPDYDYEFHTAPDRQFIILLDGEIEIETSLGEKRRFAAGDVLQLEDVTGKGHRTRNLKPILRRSVFITF
ncbi:hypothetical protein WG906_13330 [Pedobacter sp. P351]|uniref:hypothetical protein n=1 Tax=Pedobacter superstes TaxID=3133441 RepID=UPI0030AD314D